MLQYVLKKGMKFKKNHIVIFAKQTDFIKLYIYLIIMKKQCSMNNDKFGSDHHKKQSNSLFGKQIENVENYRDTKLAND